MNAACASCKGACCESFTLPAPIGDKDALVWITLRGKREGSDIRFDVPCRELRDGACGIHEIKPHVCRVFTVGGPQCIAAIRARRGNDAPRLIKLARENQG